MNEPKVPVEYYDLLRDEISTHLTELSILNDLVRALADAPQGNLLGFMSPEARQLLERLTHEELLARRDHVHHGTGTDLGLKFMNADYPIRGQASEAPMSLGPATFEVTAWASLQHLVRRATQHLERVDRHLEQRRGLCVLPRIVRETPVTDETGTAVNPGLPQLAARLRILVWDIRYTDLLTEIRRELEHLRTLGELVVDGSDRLHLGACPHCGRDTLTVHFSRAEDTNGVRIPLFARCEKDPKTGHHEHCTCESAWCDCKTTPVSFRHTWWHSPRDAPDPRIAHDWHDLAGRLNIQRATKEPTQ